MLSRMMFLTACSVVYANGANDHVKRVASLFGSHTCGYQSAIGWTTVRTFAGSVAAIILVNALLRRFSGSETPPDASSASPEFMLAVAWGAGATVLRATCLGFPIFTTHGLTEAFVGAGLMAAGRQLNFAVLGRGIVTGQARWKPVWSALAAWVVTLPCATVLAACFWLLVQSK